MPTDVLHRTLKLRPGERTTAWMMFAYSFLAMTLYNLVKPLTKGKFIDQLGPQWMPLVLLAAIIPIGWLMYLYSRASGRLSGRAVVPVTLTGLSTLLIFFWTVFSKTAPWVSVSLYVFGLIFGVLVISQFWTIANDLYDSRQARRLFGFIGGGASLGGVLGNGITLFLQDELGERNLLLVGAGVLLLCAGLVHLILRRHAISANLAAAVEEHGVGGAQAIQLLRESRHLQVIALVIGFATMAAVIVDQQVNMVAKVAGSGSASEFLARVGLYLSLACFVIQIGLTSFIHRSLGLVAALLILPLGLGATGVAILLTGAVWAPAIARVLDGSLRYSLDKTTREVLFLPLPADLKRRAKPFVDVTVDRLGKATGALLLLVLNPPWHPRLTWPQLSYASLAVMVVWVIGALAARREYLRSFRKNLGSREIDAADVRVNVADAATIETLVEELAHPDAASVLYAIDMLEMLDKRRLITPLLLHHEAPAVRARALLALSSVRADLAKRWIPAVNRLLKDEDADVRAAAVRALESLAGDEAPALLHSFLQDADPRVAATAATVLADSSNATDPPVALATLSALIADDRASAAAGRREAAAALAHISNPDFRALLVPLLTDRQLDVAREAIASARAVGHDPRFVPALVSLLSHRQLKLPARAALISFGQDVVPALAYFLLDSSEQTWVRRHVPATLAALPSQASLDALIAGVGDPDGFLRYKIIAAIETLKRENPALKLPDGAIERLLLQETARYYNYLTLRFNVVRHDANGEQSLIVRALDDKLERTLDRAYRLLGLIYPWKDIAAARHSLERGDVRTRAHAIEYLDNLLSGVIRKRVMPMIDDMPPAEKARVANSILRTRPRDLEDTVAQLIHESDPVIAAAAIAFVRTRGMWALTDDLEYAATRRAEEHLVADAATWALAGRANGAVPIDAAGHPLPIVELADRLRTIPLFDFVSVDEVFRIAAMGVQVRYQTGHTVYEEGAVAEHVQFLTDGVVRLTGSGASSDVSSPAALAFEDMLEGRPVRHTMTATAPAVSLSLSGAALLTMMSDNIVLARGFFRMLVGSDPSRPLCAVVHLPPEGQLVTSWRPPLEPVEKAGLLRQTPILGRASVDQLLDLVTVAREIPLTAGTVLFKDTDPPSVFHVLEGEIVLERKGAESVTVGPGGMIGMADTLAGLPLRCTARVTKAGHALRIDQDPLFEVLADHGELLQGLFSGVLRASLGKSQ